MSYQKIRFSLRILLGFLPIIIMPFSGIQSKADVIESPNTSVKCLSAKGNYNVNSSVPFKGTAFCRWTRSSYTQTEKVLAMGQLTWAINNTDQTGIVSSTPVAEIIFPAGDGRDRAVNLNMNGSYTFTSRHRACTSFAFLFWSWMEDPTQANNPRGRAHFQTFSIR